jgi:galactokinase
MSGAGSRVSSALFVPGRLCLFGEHSDWAGGYRREGSDLAPGFCMVMGTDQGLRAEASPAEGVFEFRSRLPDGRIEGPVSIDADEASLAQAARSGGFFSYAAGTAAEGVARFGVRGLRLLLSADLPVGKGLSSSAAVCVLVARALDRVYGLGLSVRDEIELAYRGERRTGSECGRMDQICAYGRVPTFLCFDGEDLAVEVLSPGAEFHLLLVDLGRSKDTVRILRELNACFPDTPGVLARGVRAALGPRNRKLLERARSALESGDPEGLGLLMSEAQEEFDAHVAPASPTDLRAPRLHEVLSHPASRELAHGGKGVGSQGDGSAQLVACSAEARAALAARLERDLGVGCLPLTIRPARS